MATEQAHATDNFFVIVFECSKTTPTLRDKIAADAGVLKNLVCPSYSRQTEKNIHDNININCDKDLSSRLNRIRAWYDKYEKIKNWDSIYLITLKITELEIKELPNISKFKEFMNWQYSEFRFSMVGTIYALIIFSSRRIKKMMKFKEDAKEEIKRKQLYNMTWDLFLMDYYSRKLTSKKVNEEYLFATDDKVVQYLIKIILNTNMSGNISTLKDYLTKTDYPMFDYYIDTLARNDEREFKGKDFKTENQRYIQIEKYEKILLK